MKHLLTIVLVTLAGSAGPALAETRIVTLTVPMTCPAADPIVYERLMKNIPGVSDASARYDDLSLSVTFDDAQAGLDDILGALSDLGVAAEVRE